MQRLLSLAFALAFWTVAFGQDGRVITGNVADVEGVPLIGATVQVPNSTVGTVTDIDGNFEISVPAGTDALEINYTGYARNMVNVNTIDEVTVVLKEDVIGLEEAVVVGYAPVRRKDLVGSVASVSGEEITKEAGATVQSGLRRASGVVVQQSSGTPGAGFNIRVRGATSITASNEPLYVVDGVPIISGNYARGGIGGQGANALADINMNDVESIEVLKDASTAAIYGSRAANGVVLITTKKGVRGSTKVDLSTSYGWNSPLNTIDVVDGPRYQDYIAELYADLGIGRDLTLIGGPALDSTQNNNWQDLIFDTNPIRNVQLAISGGDVKTRFYGSLNYDDNQGILKNTRFERYNGRLNLDHTISPKFTTSVQLAYNYSKNQRQQNDNNIYGATSASLLLPPTVAIQNEDGSYGSVFGLENPVGAVNEYQNFLRTNRIIGNGSLNYIPTEWLKLSAKLNIDNLDLRESIFEPSILQSTANGSISEGSTRITRVVNEYLAQVSEQFGVVEFVGTAGAIFQNERIDRTFFVTNDVPTATPSADAAASPADVLGDISGDVLQSYIVGLNFKIANNLFVTGSFRADGSSRFVNDPWGYFPGIAAGYDFAEYLPGLDQFKLRASYGQTGNNNVGNFSARPRYSGARRYLNSPGTAPLTLGNEDLRWETTTTTDIGLDIALLDSRMAFSIGVFEKLTEDLLLERPIPTTSGFQDVLENIGEVRNRGLELSAILATIQTDDFSWTTDINFAYLDNEVLTLFNDQPFDDGFATRTAEGQALGSFFGFETDGIFQNEAEVEAGPVPDGTAVGPGDFRFVDQDGDGVITDADRTFLGGALPDWTGGINNIFNYRGLELSAYFQFQLGNEIYNNTRAFTEGLNGVFAPTVAAYEGAWREDSPSTIYPRLGRGAISSNNRRDSDRFVEDGSFVRLKTVQLGYTFGPELFGDGVPLRSIRAYVSGTNLVTWTDYSGFDPEVNTFGDENVALGTDFLTYPQARTVQIGLNVGF